ncbi:unnamed protein product [Closterium sp. Yama58-4]|nr:unnamed protein product [Closterium sp. Yama58-4]
MYATGFDLPFNLQIRSDINRLTVINDRATICASASPGSVSPVKMRGGGGLLASRFFRAVQSSYHPAAGACASTPFVPLANIPTSATATTAAAAAFSNSHSVSRFASFLSNLPPQPPPQSSPRFPPHYSPVAVSSRSFCTSSPLAQSLLTRGLAPALSQQHVVVSDPIGAARLVIARGFAKRPKKWRGDPWVMVRVPQGAEQVPASQPNAGSVGGRNQRRRMLQRQQFIKEQWQKVKEQKKEALKRRDEERRARWKAGAARAREWRERQQQQQQQQEGKGRALLSKALQSCSKAKG